MYKQTNFIDLLSRKKEENWEAKAVEKEKEQFLRDKNYEGGKDREKNIKEKDAREDMKERRTYTPYSQWVVFTMKISRFLPICKFLSFG